MCTEKYSDQTLYSNNRTRNKSDSLITTPLESPMTTARSRRIFSNDSRRDATRFTTDPWQIPVENNQTAFPFESIFIIIKIYYKIIFTEQCVELWNSIQIILQNTGQRMAPLISALVTVSMLSPSLASSFELEQIFTSSAGVPCLRSIKWPGHAWPCN